ncbi:MAG TPA: hypothetical protein VNN77_06840 [candidate division Zixibacteria bacterium]|nr:hypothetical protein [candidate division Zixibacteria bacterium]
MHMALGKKALWVYGLVCAIALAWVPPAGAQIDEREPWYFTAEEIELIYRYQEKFGPRLQNPVRAKGCFWGQGEFTATQNGKGFSAPCRFVSETTRHLKEMLKAGAARYLFPLDLDHAHLLIPARLWEEKYSKLPFDQVLPVLLTDPELAALYHASEHLTVTDPRTGKVDLAAKAWKDKRNVVGFYDGRPIEILPPNPGGTGASPPKGYYSFGGFHLLASSGGDLFIFLRDRVISFDITFEIGTLDDERIVVGSN